MSSTSVKPQLVSSVVPLIDAKGSHVMVAIAKATWHIAGADLVPAGDALPIEYVDTHVEGDPARELLLPADLTDFKPAAEVLIIRPGMPVEQASFAGRTVAVQIGSLAFSAPAQDPWPFGPVARSHPSRLQYAGTYDEYWQQERMPLLPEDFDPRFNQCAPRQQLLDGYLVGDELVTVDGLYAGAASFRLPELTVLVSGNVRQRYFSEIATLDTVLIWSEAPAITLVWRHVIRPARKTAEVGAVTVGLIRLRTARDLYG